VKNVPPELHEALRRCAAAEGVDLQDYPSQVRQRHPHDASYVVQARGFDAPLVTPDERLARADGLGVSVLLPG